MPYDDYDDFAAAYNRNWGFFADAARPTLDQLGLGDLSEGTRVLDLCCGTGQLAASLSDRFEVVGIDGSAAMIAFADTNAPNAEFIVADATDFSLSTPVAAVVSTFDSLNHIMDLDGLAACFRCVRSALEPGGIFIFDLNMAEGYEARWSDGSWQSGNDHIDVEGSWNPDEALATATITVRTIHDDGSESSTTVMLTQRCYPESDVLEALETAGFGSVDVFDGANDLDFGGIGRSFFVAR